MYNLFTVYAYIKWFILDDSVYTCGYHQKSPDHISIKDVIRMSVNIGIVGGVGEPHHLLNPNVCKSLRAATVTPPAMHDHAKLESDYHIYPDKLL